MNLGNVSANCIKAHSFRLAESNICYIRGNFAEKAGSSLFEPDTSSRQTARNRKKASPSRFFSSRGADRSVGKSSEQCSKVTRESEL
jgi:hypothetical protein